MTFNGYKCVKEFFQKYFADHEQQAFKYSSLHTYKIKKICLLLLIVGAPFLCYLRLFDIDNVHVELFFKDAFKSQAQNES